MTDKLPALHFYTGDLWKDDGAMLLDCEERGAWIQMLFIMHDNPQRRGYLEINNKPYPNDALARKIGISSEKIEKILEKIIEFGVGSVEKKTGILYSRRMVRDEEKRQALANNGKKGGRPKNQIINQTETKTITKLKPNPNQIPEDENEDESVIENEDEVIKPNNEPIYPGNVQDLNLAQSMAQDFRDLHGEDIPWYQIHQWADVVKNMRMFDKRTHAQILEKWEWSRQGWWKDNGVRVTPQMLRDKWLTIRDPSKVPKAQTSFEKKRSVVDDWYQESVENDKTGVSGRSQGFTQLRGTEPGQGNA